MTCRRAGGLKTIEAASKSQQLIPSISTCVITVNSYSSASLELVIPKIWVLQILVCHIYKSISRAYWDAPGTAFSRHVSGCQHLWSRMEPLSFQLPFQWSTSSSHWQILTWKRTGMGVPRNVVQNMEGSNVVPNQQHQVKQRGFHIQFGFLMQEIHRGSQELSYTK